MDVEAEERQRALVVERGPEPFELAEPAGDVTRRDFRASCFRRPVAEQVACGGRGGELPGAGDQLPLDAVEPRAGQASLGRCQLRLERRPGVRIRGEVLLREGRDRTERASDRGVESDPVDDVVEPRARDQVERVEERISLADATVQVRERLDGAPREGLVGAGRRALVIATSRRALATATRGRTLALAARWSIVDRERELEAERAEERGVLLEVDAVERTRDDVASDRRPICVAQRHAQAREPGERAEEERAGAARGVEDTQLA